MSEIDNNKKYSYDKCPNCESSKGFRLTYEITGRGHEDRSFGGEVLDADRSVTDIVDQRAECLNCGYGINIDNLKTEM